MEYSYEFSRPVQLPLPLKMVDSCLESYQYSQHGEYESQLESLKNAHNSDMLSQAIILMFLVVSTKAIWQAILEESVWNLCGICLVERK